MKLSALLLSFAVASAASPAFAEEQLPMPSAPPAPVSGPAGVAAPTMPRVLVIPFNVLNVPESQQWIGKGVQESLIADMGRSGAVVPITFDGPVIVEDNATAIRLAKNANVPFVIRGTVQVVGTNVRITAQVIDVRTGDTLRNTSVTGPVNELLSLQDTLSAQLRVANPTNVPAAPPVTTTGVATASVPPTAPVTAPAPETSAVATNVVPSTTPPTTPPTAPPATPPANPGTQPVYLPPTTSTPSTVAPLSYTPAPSTVIITQPEPVYYPTYVPTYYPSYPTYYYPEYAYTYPYVYPYFYIVYSDHHHHHHDHDDHDHGGGHGGGGGRGGRGDTSGPPQNIVRGVQTPSPSGGPSSLPIPTSAASMPIPTSAANLPIPTRNVQPLPTRSTPQSAFTPGSSIGSGSATVRPSPILPVPVTGSSNRPSSPLVSTPPRAPSISIPTPRASSPILPAAKPSSITVPVARSISNPTPAIKAPAPAVRSSPAPAVRSSPSSPSPSRPSLPSAAGGAKRGR